MNIRNQFFLLVIVCGVLFGPRSGLTQDTAFTYQGYLRNAGLPANGFYDLTFALFDASTGGKSVGETLTNSTVAVTNGLFTVSLDFGGGVFDGGSRWLEIGIRTDSSLAGFTILQPRQTLTAVPYAISAAHVTGTVSMDQLAGQLPINNLAGSYSNTLVLNNPSNLFAGTFSGDGSGLTNLMLGSTQPPPSVSPALTMIWIEPGTFVMGSPTNEAERYPAYEGPQTVVTLTHGFWMANHLVTQGEFQTVVGTNPSHFTGDLNLPVESVTWADATNYCGLLTQRERAAGRLPINWEYRLPTNAEWEYACRALTTTRSYWGDDIGHTNIGNYAWYNVNGALETHPVGQKLANPWGLSDMQGNLWQWCQDWFDEYPGRSVIDPQGPATGIWGTRVVRGGSWYDDPTWFRSAARYDFPPDNPNYREMVGFRVVLALCQ